MQRIVKMRWATIRILITDTVIYYVEGGFDSNFISRGFFEL